jgi:hypothetical protein
MTVVCFCKEATGGVCCRSTDDGVKDIFVSLLGQLGTTPPESARALESPYFIVSEGRMGGFSAGIQAHTLPAFLSRHAVVNFDDVTAISDLLILDQVLMNESFKNEKDLHERISVLMKIQ